MKKYFALLTLCLLPWGALQAQDTSVEDRVAAVVNDKVITTTDLQQRFQFTLKKLNAELSDAEKNSLFRRTLAGLIDEELQSQYARQNRLVVSPLEIRRAITYAEQANGWPTGYFYELSKGYETTAMAQLTSEIQWTKIIESTIKPRITIANTEIDRLIQKMLSGSHVVEREISQIFMTVEESSKEAQVLERIEKVYAQLQEGVAFAKLARAFSEDSSAPRGGYMGWFATGELAPALEDVLATLTPGSVSRPIRTPLGWHIMKLDRQRKTNPLSMDPVTEWELYQINFNTTAEMDKDQLKDQANALRKELNSLEAVQRFIVENKNTPAHAGSTLLTWRPVEDLPAEIQTHASRLQSKRMSPLIETESGWVLVYPTGARQKMSEKLDEYRTRVRTHLEKVQIEMASRRFMRDLRRQAFIDIRI